MVVSITDTVKTKWYIGEKADNGSKAFYGSCGALYYQDFDEEDPYSSKMEFDTEEAARYMMDKIYEYIKSYSVSSKANTELMVFSVQTSTSVIVTIPE